MNAYRLMVWKETCVSPSGRWETMLILILNNLRSYIKKILNWLCDFYFVTEDRDKRWAVVNMVVNCPVNKVIRIS